MNSDQAEKRIRKAARDGKVEFASQEGIESFNDQFVDDFLVGVLDCKSAWISDRSELSDFGARDEATYERIERIYGVDVRGTDNILAILRAIHAFNATIQ